MESNKMMRVISGELKGKKIQYIKNQVTRPLKDSVKENIFNIITHSKEIKVSLKNSTILDAYSGIGSFGIECLSRGASEVTFVESDKNTFNILSQNIKSLSFSKKSILIQDKIENFLNLIKKKYDIFFFDPPFKDFNFSQNLKIIQKTKIFKKNHLVILHREAKFEENIESYFKLFLTKSYGRSKIFFGSFN
tara:strand:+ start:3023 stop:3598 length:576 start_codon:yes stop_codon:yes gene_type:complete